MPLPASPSPAGLRHIGLSLGGVEHWHDGLGEFSRALVGELATQAAALREAHAIALHVHLPERWHGMFGSDVSYLATHTLQRLWHLRRTRFALWHRLHQHIRLRPPLGTRRRVETVHDLNFLITKAGAKRERYRGRLYARLRRCDQVIAISRHVASELHTELPQLSTPIEVIHNGATDLSAHAQRPVELEGGAAPFLLHVSRMAPSKNIGALLALAEAWPEQWFVFAGGASPYTDDVQRQIVSRSLRNVSLRLDVDNAQKAWLYAHCDALLFPSLAEGFGLPPLEAMHFGKPVFLSRLTSLPEVGGDAALYFDDFEPTSMRQCIERGLASHRSDLRAAATIEHARHFTWRACASRHIELYLRLLGRQREQRDDAAA
jgi:glycosyltransferase involved in cell wall biosynthesis